MFNLDQEKYIRIARTQGHQAALTQLHRDTERWEFDCFEGKKGWNPEMWKALDAVRSLQRELWNEAVHQQPAAQRR